MKKIVSYLLSIVVAVLITGYIFGVFKVDADVQVNKDIKRNVLKSSYRVLDEVHKCTGEAFDSVKEYLGHENGTR